MDVAEWIERYRRAWEQADADAVVELFTENASYRNNIFREPHVGRAAIRAYWEQATGTQSEIEVRFGRPVVESDRVSVEWWTTMDEVDEGELTLPGCLVLRFSPEGLCEELREYWHFEKGRRDPPAGWGE
ncbi:MAG: nuclear transport factor 2 family protein [Actinobacteria bacterium]|nr:nuclear transport factor 2 family protein [Actinomycetota bacterium]